MRIGELKEHYGTWTAVAHALNIGMNTHQYWRRIGYIPLSAQCLIEKKTKGLFKAREEDAVPVTTKE